MNKLGFYYDVLNMNNLLLADSSGWAVNEENCLQLNNNRRTDFVDFGSGYSLDIYYYFNTAMTIDTVGIADSNLSLYQLEYSNDDINWYSAHITTITSNFPYNGAITKYLYTVGTSTGITAKSILIRYSAVSAPAYYIGQLLLGKKIFDLNYNPSDFGITLDFNSNEDRYYNGLSAYRTGEYSYDIDIDFKMLDGISFYGNYDLINITELLTSNFSFVIATNNDINLHGFRPDFMKLRCTSEVVFEWVNNGLPNTMQISANLRSAQ